MPKQVIIVLILTGIIYLISTLAYSVRIVGVRTGRIAISFAISTVGILASLYAGCLNPELRTTCSTLAAVINGVATILMFIFVDPYISMLTDDVLKGECSQLQFHRCIIFIVGGLIAGTVLAQFLLVPSAEVISFIARLI